MEKLKQILSIAKCSVSLTVNNHRDYYENVIEHLKNEETEIDVNILNKMIELDTIIHLQIYPNTPIGSYSVYHYDLDTCISIALDLLNKYINP